MGDLIKDYNELESKIKMADDRIEQLEELSDDVKYYIALLNEKSILDKKKKKLEASYYETKMRNCKHIFAETMSVVYGSKIDENGGPITDYDKYHLIFNHYCLKCGCTTDNSIIFDIYRNIDPLFRDEPTNKVRPLIQTEIIEQANNFTKVDCTGLTTKDVAKVWLQIRNNHSDLDFNQLMDFFKLAIDRMQAKETNTCKVRSKALPTSVYTHIK